MGIFTIPLSFQGIVNILNIKGNISDTWIKLLGIDKESGMYYGLSEIINAETNGSIVLWGIFLIFLLIIVVQIIWFFIENSAERILIIEHSSINQMNFIINKECKEEYMVSAYRINQYQTFNSGLPLETMIVLAISELNMHIEKIKRKITKGKYLGGYAGIANIPMTFMLGYELGDENKKLYFHKFRDRKTPPALKDDKFHLMKEGINQLPFKYEIIKNTDRTRDGKILLLIQLTQPLREVDYQAVLEENDYVIKFFVTDMIDYDIVNLSSQIDEYTDEILAQISEIQKEPHITQIKICIAASSAFIFALGTKFSKTQNKETVIFHYQQDTYPWGVNVHRKRPVILKDV